MYPFFYWMDPIYFVFALPALFLALYAQWKVQSTYQKYTRVRNMRGITGLQAAEILLSGEGLRHVNIEGTPGQLTDHYDPRSKVLRLSQGVAHSPSVASLGIVAHEVGHALQDATAYAPLRLRGAIVPAVNLGSWLGPIIFIFGFMMQSPTLATIGLLGFAATAVFALITLPVELDASRRALRMLSGYGLVTNQELGATRAVLNAAALTYVAAVAQAISTLLYYLFLFSGMRRED
jgi:hypothetical protein